MKNSYLSILLCALTFSSSFAEAVSIKGASISQDEQFLNIDIEYTGCSSDEFTLTHNFTCSSGCSSTLIPLNPVSCDNPRSIQKQVQITLDEFYLRTLNYAGSRFTVGGSDNSYASIRLPLRVVERPVRSSPSELRCELNILSLGSLPPSTDGRYSNLNGQYVAAYSIPVGRCTDYSNYPISFGAGINAPYSFVGCHYNSTKDDSSIVLTNVSADSYLRDYNKANLTGTTIVGFGSLDASFPISSSQAGHIRCQFR